VSAAGEKMDNRNKIRKSVTAAVAALLLVIPVLEGCEKRPPVTEKPGSAAPLVKPPTQEVEAAAQEAAPEEGYIYQPGDRRDPFVPLIVSTKKTGTKGEGTGRLGTLESYDISEFALLAIAKKGEKNYALLITPDNRSFSVSKGTIIGLNKGRVEEITGSKVILVEYSKDFRGDTRPKHITLELKER